MALPEGEGVCHHRERVCPQKKRFCLDLGTVKNIAEVTINGRKYPALWKPPFTVDITDALPAGWESMPDVPMDIEEARVGPDPVVHPIICILTLGKCAEAIALLHKNGIILCIIKERICTFSIIHT